jgi:LmbE family N-acetylglucosaminyl deacetylase
VIAASRDTFENRVKVASAIRRHRPQVVLAPYYDLPIGRGLGHNDHYKTGQIVANAFNLAHLAKAPCEGEPHQAKAIYFYFVPPGTRPTFVVDISGYVDDWLAAIDCHRSQFYHPDRPRPSHLPHPREGVRVLRALLGLADRRKTRSGVARHHTAQRR